MHGPSDSLGDVLLELAGFITDPRQDWRMMAEAGLDIDPAFLPVLVRLGVWGPASAAELSGQVGRDHSTMSRQLARLEAAGLVVRSASQTDGRVRTACVTSRGKEAVAALAAARRRLLDRALGDWTAEDRESLSRLMGRFAGALKAAASAA